MTKVALIRRHLAGPVYSVGLVAARDARGS